VSIPVRLVESDVVADVCTDVAVGILCLSVRLRVVSGAEIEEGTELTEELSPKIRSEFWVAIGDECLGDAMEAEDVVTEECSELDCAVVHLGGDNVDVFGGAINQGTYSVVTFGCSWEAGHEVDRDGVPTGFWYGEGLEKAGGNQRRWFIDLAAVACPYIGSNVGRHAWPPKVSSENVQGSVLALVSRKRRVVCVVKEAMSKVLVV
jgi:hypothetical protein